MIFFCHTALVLVTMLNLVYLFKHSFDFFLVYTTHINTSKLYFSLFLGDYSITLFWVKWFSSFIHIDTQSYISFTSCLCNIICTLKFISSNIDEHLGFSYSLVINNTTSNTLTHFLMFLSEGFSREDAKYWNWSHCLTLWTTLGVVRHLNI